VLGEQPSQVEGIGAFRQCSLPSASRLFHTRGNAKA
jgi:hypothetical protein